MEEDVGGVETRGPHPVDHPIPTESQDHKGAVGFMRLWIREGNPPEIVVEDLREGCVLPRHNRRRKNNKYC